MYSSVKALPYSVHMRACHGATISNDSRPPSQKCRDRVANLMRLSAIAAKKIAAGAMMPPAPLTIKASAQEIHTKYHHFCSPSRRRKYEYTAKYTNSVNITSIVPKRENDRKW